MPHPWNRRMSPACWLILTLALVAAPGTVKTEEVSREAWARERLEAALAADGGTGVQIALVRDGRIVFTAAAGQADLEAEVEMTPHTHLRIGSVSKVLTAGLAARLVAEDKLALDVPVQRYLPDFPTKEGDVTVRRLAQHTAGIRHYDFSNLAEANNQRPYPRLEDALALFAEDPLVAPAGSTHHYSSFGYNLLGVVAARAAGSPFAQALEQWVTGPLRLAGTVIDAPLTVVPGRSRFYTVRQGGEVINTIWRDSSDYYPSGGLLSTAEDLARFAWQTFAGEPVRPQERQLATTPGRLGAGEGRGEAVAYTFGWQVESAADGSVKWFGHGGLTNGATAEVRFVPDEQLAIAVITNYNFWFDAQPSVLRVAFEEIAALWRPTS